MGRPEDCLLNDLIEPIAFGHKCVIQLIRLLLPSHVDTAHAADYLREKVGQHDKVTEWGVVRLEA